MTLLDQLKAIQAALTPGEWHYDGLLVEKWNDMGIEADTICDCRNTADAKAIAEFRNLRPALIAELSPVEAKPKPTLDATDAPGWYQCRYRRNGGDHLGEPVARWFEDGMVFMHPGERVGCDPENYTDFVALKVGQPVAAHVSERERRLEEALQFYANPENYGGIGSPGTWVNSGEGAGVTGEFVRDLGKIAAAALAARGTR